MELLERALDRFGYTKKSIIKAVDTVKKGGIPNSDYFTDRRNKTAEMQDEINKGILRTNVEDKCYE
jgi:hypothetical protein